jgi:hypothetical protein
MQIDEYLSCDAVDLARLVREGETTAAELAECAAALAESWNPSINAVLELFDDVDTTPAPAPGDAPFSGVPFLIKDLVIQAEGRLSEMGSRLAAGLVAPQDSDLMARFRQAGLVTLGRTATPEMGYRELTRKMMRAAAELCDGKLLLTHEGGYNTWTVPFFGLAVLEELSGIKTSTDDPFLELAAALGGQDLQAHQTIEIEKAELLLANLG